MLDIRINCGSIFSPPEPKAHKVSLQDGHDRLALSTILKIFSEIAWPIKLKFFVEPPWVVALKFYSRYFGHMTKMAVKPIYGKKPSKIFFSRTGGQISMKLGM